jgi:type VI secretion system protein ImpG
MSDELLPYYERELSFIRKLSARFAKAHPVIAGRLRLGEDGETKDPHVERMIEAFAYLNARTRHKIEDEFPELTESLLGVLYPHYQAPIPSMSIVQFELDPEQKQLTAGHTIPRHTSLETDPIHGEPCRFRTCYPVNLWPIEVQEASLRKPPFLAPPTKHSARAKGVLRLVLGCQQESLTFGELSIPALRFFLKGPPHYIHRMYELILNNTLEVALATSREDQAPILLGMDNLRPVGFEPDEGILPYSPRSFVGYRLLTEYFAFAEKFLFFDLAGLSQAMFEKVGNRLEIYFYLDRTSADLEQNLSADNFRLGCTPIVNLYEQRAEPIQLSQTEYEYRVVPDARRLLAHEIHTIERVTATSPDGRQIEFRPFYSVKHASADGNDAAYWNATRKTAEHTTPDDSGTEMFLSLVDLHFQPTTPADWTLDIETVCLNRDLPHRLPFGGDQPRLQMTVGGGLVGRITCLTPPTETLRPALRQGALWRLISHLSLNHLSLVNADDKTAEALREILKLYDFADNAETRKMIDGIVGVSSRRVVGRIRGSVAVAFCRGLEVAIEFNEERFSGSGLFLFASVLERFLALYCSINSFTQMVATVQGREGELRRWQPRVGEKILL